MEIPTYLVNEHYNDRYFDVVDAIAEADHIFFKGCSLRETLLSPAMANKEFRIGETGFGAGRLFAAFLDFLEKSKTSERVITWNSVELHPLPIERMSGLLEGFRPAIGPHIDTLIQAYRGLDLSAKEWQTATFTGPFGSLVLNLWLGEALEMAAALPAPCDAWFLDGHGPKKNPAMWRPELLVEIGKKTSAGGTLATFTVAGDVRRALEAAGFTLEKVPGMGGKHWVLRGIKNV